MKAELAAAPMELRAPGLNWKVALYERDYEAALTYLDNWEIDAVDSQVTYRPKAWFYGVTHELAGLHELAAQESRTPSAMTRALRPLSRSTGGRDNNGGDERFPVI